MRDFVIITWMYFLLRLKSFTCKSVGSRWELYYTLQHMSRGHGTVNHKLNIHADVLLLRWFLRTPFSRLQSVVLLWRKSFISLAAAGFTLRSEFIDNCTFCYINHDMSQDVMFVVHLRFYFQVPQTTEARLPPLQPSFVWLAPARLASPPKH